MLPGPSTNGERATFEAYYDGHKDAYFVTDVSSKSQANALHINHATALLVAATGATHLYLANAAVGVLIAVALVARRSTLVLVYGALARRSDT